MALVTVTVRSATNADLPAIWQLILDSYLAIVDGTHESFRDTFAKAGLACREGDLKDIEAAYQSSPWSHFWVAEAAGHGVVGCVALKRANEEEADLVRMAVDEKLRGKKIGEALIQALFQFAREKLYLRIVLVTINKRAAQFYKKMGFVSSAETEMAMPPAEGVYRFNMVRYLGDKLINNVAVIGGTHGNERIGVALAKWWIDHPQELERPSFRARAVLANTAAAAKNLRYVDTDLNRLFTVGEPRDSQLAEVQRAEELERELGGAKTAAKSEGACDFIIDLHSTTSNMGLSLVLCAENDLFSHRVAQAMDQASGGSLKMTGAPGKKDQCWSIDSVAASGLAIEVGPLAHGTLSMPLLASTKALVGHALDYIEQHNQRLLQLLAAGAERVAVGGRDLVFGPVGLAPPFASLDFYERATVLEYPRGPDGSVRGIISPALNGRDWCPVNADTELFVDVDGTPIAHPLPVIPIPGPPMLTRPPAQLYAIFINEAAYLERGIAMVLTQKVAKPVY